MMIPETIRNHPVRWGLGALGFVFVWLWLESGWGPVSVALHATSSNEFCYVCHSHDQFIRPEYEASTHFRNASGVRAQCADCHLPHDNFAELLVTKIIVSADIIPEVMGKLSTQKKYDAHKEEMAESVRAQFRANDSKFCRHCHAVEAMNPELQSPMAGRIHASMAQTGKTCIDCHRNLVHTPAESHAAR